MGVALGPTETVADFDSLKSALVTRVLEGDGEASVKIRRAAFDNTGLEGPIRTLADKVAREAHLVSDEDFAAVRAAGLTEDQIFEIVVCAAIGHACRQYDAALEALDAAVAGRR
jgi:alkylhydroperoxidase family enzyme